MHLRRPLALTAGALVLSLGGLTSCGFDLMTDEPYTPGVGTNDRDGQVAVLSAVVVAAQPNEGTFVVTLSNTSASQAASLTGLAGTDLEVDEFEPVEIDPLGVVNLADEGGIQVSGDFDGGQVLPVTLTYESGDSTTVNVPVVTACGPYVGLDLTEDSEFIPYDCDFEAPPAGEHGGGEVDPAGGDSEESE
jgi:hypothetical protein